MEDYPFPTPNKKKGEAVMEIATHGYGSRVEGGGGGGGGGLEVRGRYNGRQWQTLADIKINWQTRNDARANANSNEYANAKDAKATKAGSKRESQGKGCRQG